VDRFPCCGLVGYIQQQIKVQKVQWNSARNSAMEDDKNPRKINKMKIWKMSLSA
jgi:hypothetical protein